MHVSYVARECASVFMEVHVLIADAGESTEAEGRANGNSEESDTTPPRNCPR